MTTYKNMIHDTCIQMEKEAVWGAIARSMAKLAPKAQGVTNSIVTAAKTVGGKVLPKAQSVGQSFMQASVAKKALSAGAAGAGIGAVAGGGKYNAANDDGSFGSSRIGGVLKGAVGGAAMGAAGGAFVGGGMKYFSPKLTTKMASSALQDMYLEKLSSSQKTASQKINELFEKYSKQS